MPALNYTLQAQHTTGLTPRLQQAVKLLQLSTLDCAEEVAQALATNPFLEDWAHAQADMDEQHPAPDSTGASPHQDEASSVEFTEYPAVEQPTSYSGDYPISNHRGAGHETPNDVGDWGHDQPSLRDNLQANLCGVKLSTRAAWLIELIIDSLDEDGYLRTPFPDLIDSRHPGPIPRDSEWKTALRMVQQLGAPGVGARDLAECLTLQLEAAADQPGRKIAMRIVAQALEQLGRCDYAGLAYSMACSEEDIGQACALIRSLNPRPGACFTPADPACYIVADAVVRRVGKRWVAMPNTEAAPRLRVNDLYTRMFRESRYRERSLMAHALQEARWLVRSLEQRTITIQRVAQAIVARQQTFFDYGAIALRPLMLSEIADELELHESTVSRATSGKYLSSPLGIFEFKYFFSRELATRTGGTCSATAVRALIREMIDEEDPRTPLSDVDLARKLAQEGVGVARRTVSKYRAQIKCPPAELRRAAP